MVTTTTAHTPNITDDRSNSQTHKPPFPAVPDLESFSSHLTPPWSIYRKRLTPKYRIVWRDLILCYLFLFLGIPILVYIHSYLGNLVAFTLFPLFAIWTGYWLHSLHLFMHEAAHFGLHPNRHWNDRLANLLICPFTFTDIHSYRNLHWDHHLYLGTPQDTETSYFNAPTPAFFVQTLTGIYAIKTLLKRMHNNTPRPKRTALISPHWTNLLRSMLFHFPILISSTAFNSYAVPLAWFVGVAVFFPFFGALRQLLRHRDENADPNLNYNETPHGPVLRSFGNDLISRTFGNAGFNLHLLHHWDPYISYTRLPEMEAYLTQTQLLRILEDSRTSYWALFVRLLKKTTDTK